MKFISSVRAKIKNAFLDFKQSRLMYHWEKKNYDKVAYMFRKQKTYSELKLDSFPFIFFMISQGNKEAIEIFLKKINYTNKVLNDQENQMKALPIGYAFLQQQYQIVDIFEKFGSSIVYTNTQIQNILHLAAIYKRQQPYKRALGLGIDVNLPDEFGNTPFHYACRVGSVEMITSSIAAKAKKLMNKNDQYPIHMAIQSGNLNCVTLLLDDLKKSYLDYDLIHSAAKSGSVEVVQYLLKKKPASLNFSDKQGLTPLHYAVSLDDEEIFNFLIQQPQIQINKQDSFGNTPLHLAFINNNLKMIQKIISKNPGLDITNEDNMTPLDYGISSQEKKLHSLIRGLSQKSSKIKDWTSIKY